MGLGLVCQIWYIQFGIPYLWTNRDEPTQNHSFPRQPACFHFVYHFATTTPAFQKMCFYQNKEIGIEVSGLDLPHCILRVFWYLDV